MINGCWTDKECNKKNYLRPKVIINSIGQLSLSKTSLVLSTPRTQALKNQ